LRLEVPHLRIVSDALWHSAHARFASRAEQYGRLHGGTNASRKHHDVEARHLLSGFARCACCGGGLTVQTRKHGGDKRVRFYGCHSYWKRGRAVCENGLVARVELVDDEVLATLRDDILRPSIVERAIELALAELSPVQQEARRAGLRAEHAALDAEHEELAARLARGGDIATMTDLVGRLQAIEVRRAEVRALRSSRQAKANVAPPEGLTRGVGQKLDDWKGLLTRNVPEGREVLRQLLVGPIRFRPVVEERRRGYAFEGAIALDRLIAGEAIEELVPTLWRPQAEATEVGILRIAGFSDLRAA
jgi:hypothetical protein